MPFFPQFMAEMAERRGIRRAPDGSRVTFRLRLQDSAAVTVLTDELDPAAACRALSEPWPVPPASSAYGEFMRVALGFNRNALHHLPCGIVQDPANSGQYRLIWQVPVQDLPEAEWSRQLRLFGTLANKAWSVMPRPGQQAAARRPGAGEEHQVIFMP